MELKLEVLITVTIAIILSATYMVEFKHRSSETKAVTKEMEFTDTTIIEVDTESMLSISFGTYGVRDTGVLTVDNVRYHTNSIELLRAKKGTYKGDKLYLDGNITVNQKIGHDYIAEHAIYNKTTKILDITSPFTAYMNTNIIKGNTLRYYTEEKVATAKRINAVLYTSEK